MKLLLTGDISPTHVTNPLFEKMDISTLFTDTRQLFQGNDFVFVNLECALTRCKMPIQKIGPALKAAPQTAQTLKTLGVTHCGLSNNHVFDFGRTGIRDTLAALGGAGLEYTGFGSDYENSRKNLILESNGERVCIIAVCEHEYSYALPDRMGSRPYDPYDTPEDIRKGKACADKVLVIYHGGKEFCKYPSPRLHQICHAMSDNGADLILCQHSHCIGCYENYNQCHILYGQGNFHFVMPRNEEGWNSGLAVRYDTGSNELEFVFCVSGGNGIALAKGQESTRLLKEFEQRNRTLQSGEWKEGWQLFCEENRKGYVDRLTKALSPDASAEEKAMFGHYLDCEAHSDLIRELFPTANQTNELPSTPR